MKGERLRTIKLRGQLSQGLLLNMAVAAGSEEGADVTDILGIKKWEKAIPAQLAGQVRGNFPSLIPKTDQERVQNLVKEVAAAANLRFEVTEKLEGSSMTCYLINGEFGVCSRNLDLKRDETNSFWATAIAEDIEAKMRAVPTGGDFAIQGELIGPGVQGNIYKLSKLEFRVFDVYNVTLGDYLRPAARREFVEKYLGLKHVPVLHEDKYLSTDVDTLLSWAEGSSELCAGYVEREGIVFKQVDGGMTFKAISNSYLIKEK